MTKKVFYKEIAHEKAVFMAANHAKIPLLLKGPTGCGKTRFVEAMAQELEQQIITIACNDETSSTDLLGRFLIKGGETVWQDGPVTIAVKEGHILYLDEIAEAREDVITVLHSLSDHRRELYIDKLGQSIKANEKFAMIISFNPGYQKSLKELKPSTRQRFTALEFNYPEANLEIEIINEESGLEIPVCKNLIKIAQKIRKASELGLAETVSTRLLVNTAKLIKDGLAPRLACQVGITYALTDDQETAQALTELINLLI